MIKILNDAGRYGPIFICDYCGQRIKEAGLAAAITCDSSIADGEMSDVAYAHKGACHKALEQKFSTPGAHAGWDELKFHILNLGMNVGLSPEKLMAHKQSLQELGM
ncbi:MAG TPA: hypothetical protein VGO11_02940 [Chthoniobacteraceae bacterium]|jgi:hypothetical protein|nr:hypothetical protein [Chthoniobacteraceae bacterium]